MPLFRPALDRASIVLIGRFNPAIFQPAWLAAQGLIRKEEAAEAKGLVFSSDLASFTADWLAIQVTSERFQAHTDDPAHAQPLRDIVLSVFGLLEHTPFNQMGMNRHVHYQLESDEQAHRLGHLLAPKDIWSRVLDEPGLRSLTIWGRRAEAPGATVQVVVEPSKRIHPGLYFSVNEHYERSEPDSSRELMTTLAQRWEKVHLYTERAAEIVLQEGANIAH